MIINSKIYNIPTVESAASLSETVRLVVISRMVTSVEGELLQKMLLATGLNSNEFIHIISNESKNTVNSFVNHVNGLKIISFDVPLVKLGLQVEVRKYRMFSLQNMDIVMVDDLSSIAEEVNLKKYIWNVLKAWFIDEE